MSFHTEDQAPPEFPAIREQLARARQEIPMKKYRVVRPFNAGWAEGKAGAEILLSDVQAQNLAPWIEPINAPPAPSAVALAAPESEDPPGAPPPMTTQMSSQVEAGGLGRKKGRR